MIPYYIFKDINEKIYCSCKLPKNEVIFPYLHRPTTSVTKSWITQLIRRCLVYVFENICFVI